MTLKKPIQLLHVDDSATLRKTVERGLEPFKDHYILTQASSVDEAWALISGGKKFELILTDWLMGTKSGLDLLCMVKSHPAHHHLPVIFLTSEHESSSLLTAVAFGAAGLLKKPATGAEIHAYFQKKSAAIEETFTPKEDNFAVKAIPLLQDFKSLLPLKNSQDLVTSLRGVQILKALAGAGKWPLLVDYCLKIETALQDTIKKGIGHFAPITSVLNDFHTFMEQAVAELALGNPHAFVSLEAEKNLKNYLANLEAGWFNGNPSQTAVEGLHLPWDVVSELQKHLSAEGLKILEKYLPIKKVG